MKDNLTIHGLDLSELGIGDVIKVDDQMAHETILDSFVRQILGSITFGPVQFVDLSDPEDEDDGEWEYAE